MFMTEKVFISEQIQEYKSGALVEISNKFSIQSIDFSYMILQLRFNSLENFITMLYEFQKHSGLVVLLEKS